MQTIKFLILPLLSLIIYTGYSQNNSQAIDFTRFVNPFMGTGDHGHTYPGAVLPHGMVQLSPDTRMENWDGSSGYHYSDKTILGFSHTHLSGTGEPEFCDILFMPTVGINKISQNSGSPVPLRWVWLKPRIVLSE